MKRCPQCDLTYIDENLNFCLSDGTELVPITAQSQPTVVMPREAPRKKSRILLWVGLAFALFFGGLAGAGLLGYFIYSNQRERDAERISGVSTTPTPRPTATATWAPTPSPSPTLSPGQTPPANNVTTQPTDGSDEITPIAWNTSTVTFKGEPGTVYKFECPASGTAGIVWGTDVYTGDSSICTAAVHAGIIKLETGGTVTVEYRPGRQVYGATTRNGVTTHNYGEFKMSFVVR